MLRLTNKQFLAILLSLFVSLFTQAAPTSDRPKTSDITSNEIKQVSAVLTNLHYNRDAVRPADCAQIIPGFMGDLDGQRLFFLNTDKADFEKRFGSSLYYNLHDIGSIDPAFDIFEVYETRVKSRIAWIFDELKKDIDVQSRDFYRLDRTKSDWPESAQAADELWRKRLKFELGTELLNSKSGTADTTAKIAPSTTAKDAKSTPEIVAKDTPKTVDEAKKEIRKRYERMLKNIGEIEAKDIAEMFLSSYAQLYDPHSTYWNADSFEDFSITMKLQLVGIGALLSVKDDTCVIEQIIPGGPADLDKRLKPEDKILAVGEPGKEPVDIIGMKLRRIVNLIRGKKGTEVRLIVQPGDDMGNTVRKEIVLTRDVVKINSARAHAAIFDVPKADGTGTAPIGVISLPSFYGGEDESGEGERISATKDVAELIKRLKAENIQAMVLDLRRNGGGLLSEAIDLTGLFIDSGPVVQVRNFEGRVDVNGDEDNRITYAGPLAVLVDRFSASASEIVAGALQNYGRAIVIGDSSTHGKGTVQTVIEMKNLMPMNTRSITKTGATKLTIQKFYLPNGASTQLKGVVPDIVLPSFEDYLPIGEADLPKALVWDKVPTTMFDGSTISPTVLRPLLDASSQRQKDAEEFTYLRRNVDWFKMRQDQKLISTNLEDRKKQKESDDAFQKEMKTERVKLEKGTAYPFREVRLVPPTPPRVKARAKNADGSPVLDDLEEEDQAESYSKLDVQLRESLRVMTDVLQLAKDPKRWAHEFPPLTAEAVRDRS